MLGTITSPCVVFKPFPGRASLPTKIVSWNVVKQLEPTFIIMSVGMFLTLSYLALRRLLFVKDSSVLAIYPIVPLSSLSTSHLTLSF
jgi:hypothetical protein